MLFWYDTSSYSGKKKRKGNRDAVEKYGLARNERFIPFKESSVQKTKELLLETVAHSPEAMICGEDAIAAAALKFANAKGLVVPSQLNVIGYNNSLLAKCCEPELTSIDNKVQEVCERAITMLMSVLGGNQIENIKVVPCLIKKRNTTDF